MLGFWRNYYGRFLFWVVSHLDLSAEFLRPIAIRLRPRLFSFDETLLLQAEAESLLKTPNANSLSALADSRIPNLSERDEEFKEIMRAYFYTKSAIALCESRGSILTIQVFNEFRSAFDHYSRALTAEDQDKERKAHLRSVTGHIQRAFLDVTKLGCSTLMDSITRNQSKFNAATIGIAKNGDYAKTMAALIYDAEEKYYTAKIEETRLGDEASRNDTVRDLFFIALKAHVLAQKYMQKHLGDLYISAGHVRRIEALKWFKAAGGRAIGYVFIAWVTWMISTDRISLPFEIPFLKNQPAVSTKK
jgi:hypothetical protein